MIGLFKKKRFKAYSIPENGMMYIKGHQNGKELNLLLNTGSEDNIIDSKVLSCLDVKEYDWHRTMRSIDTTVSASSIYPIDFTIDNCNLCTHFVGVNVHTFQEVKTLWDIELHGMLGCAFFNKYKCSINYKKKELTIEL